MTVMMAVAALWGALQLFVLAWPTRSVRLSTLLLAFAVGVYGCGLGAALLELAYTRTMADESGRALAEVVRTTSYTVAPWVEELVKATPLLLIGLSAKVRRQWGIADFTVLGAALGAGFGLLESLLRYSLDAHRSIARDGGWVIPDSLSPPFVPGPAKVFTAWLPTPVGSLDLGQSGATATFSHLVWTTMAGLGVGLLWRTRGAWRLSAVLPVGAAIGYHTLNNYTANKPGTQSQGWLESLDGKAWAIPLICLTLAMVYDLLHLHRAKRAVVGVQLATERANGDTAAALVGYAAWRLPWSLLIALRFLRLRRCLYYAAARASPKEIEPLRRLVAQIATRIDASDQQDTWKALDVRVHLKAMGGNRRRWLLLIPCLLAIPSLIVLGVGSFKSTADIQRDFTTGSGPRILLWFALASLAWIAYQVITLLRLQRALRDQSLAEPLAALRLRVVTALGSAAAGTLLLWRGWGAAGPDGAAIPPAHLLEALGEFLVYLGILLLLLSVLALFPPSGFAYAFAGGGVAGATLDAAVLARAGILLMAVGAGTAAGDQGGGEGGQRGGQSDAPGNEPADGLSNRVRPPREGDTNYVVDNPGDWSDTITDIDRIDGGVLWEEKTATGRVPGMNVDNWVGKHVFKKLDSYIRARPHMQGFEDAPIGIRFTEPGATPGFKSAVESGVEKWLQSNPGVDVRVWWAQ